MQVPGIVPKFASKLPNFLKTACAVLHDACRARRGRGLGASVAMAGEVGNRKSHVPVMARVRAPVLLGQFNVSLPLRQPL